LNDQTSIRPIDVKRNVGPQKTFCVVFQPKWRDKLIAIAFSFRLKYHTTCRPTVRPDGRPLQRPYRYFCACLIARSAN